MQLPIDPARPRLRPMIAFLHVAQLFVERKWTCIIFCILLIFCLKNILLFKLKKSKLHLSWLMVFVGHFSGRYDFPCEDFQFKMILIYYFLNILLLFFKLLIFLSENTAAFSCNLNCSFPRF